jgi:hypothetical protein
MSCGESVPGGLGYSDYVNRLAKQDLVLAAELSGFRTVEKVLQWMQTKGLGHAQVDLVGQDEFSYDFLLQLEPEGRWLGFGVS